MNDLERRLRQLEDKEAIRSLKEFYARCADEKYTENQTRRSQEQIDRITQRQVSIFTEDAIWDGGAQFGRKIGRAAIYENLRTGPWAFTVHYFTPMTLEIDGDSAQARWALWQVGTLLKGNMSVFHSAFTDDKYVRTDAGWRMSYMKLTPVFLTPFSQPWSERKNSPLAP